MASPSRLHNGMQQRHRNHRLFGFSSELFYPPTPANPSGCVTHSLIPTTECLINHHANTDHDDDNELSTTKISLLAASATAQKLQLLAKFIAIAPDVGIKRRRLDSLRVGGLFCAASSSPNLSQPCLCIIESKPEVANQLVTLAK